LVPGIYVYVGSACGSGGLAARIARHLRTCKRLHWHIDYLTAMLQPIAILYRESTAHEECAWVQELLRAPGTTVPMKGFGSGDCRAGCPAHLVQIPQMTLLESTIPGILLTGF